MTDFKRLDAWFCSELRIAGEPTTAAYITRIVASDSRPDAVTYRRYRLGTRKPKLEQLQAYMARWNASGRTEGEVVVRIGRKR